MSVYASAPHAEDLAGRARARARRTRCPGASPRWPPCRRARRCRRRCRRTRPHASATSSGSVTSVVPSTARSTPASKTRSSVSIVRMPPPTSTCTPARPSTIALDVRRCSRGSPSTAPSRSTTWIHSAPCVGPALRLVDRVVVVDGDGVEPPLPQPHDLAVEDVDRGKDDHVCAPSSTIRPKLREQPQARSPTTSPGGTARRRRSRAARPRRTASPYSVAADDSRRVGRLQVVAVHEVERRALRDAVEQRGSRAGSPRCSSRCAASSRPPGSRSHVARHDAEALPLAVLEADVGEQLHAEADAEERHARARRARARRPPCRSRAGSRAASRNAPTPGQHDAVGRRDHARGRSSRRRRRRPRARSPSATLRRLPIP